MADHHSQLASAGQAHGGGHNDPHRFDVRTRKNNEQMLAFTIAMGTLGLIIIISQWLRRMAAPPALRSSAKTPLPAFIARKFRGILLRNMPVLPSIGHGVLVSIYLIINLCITFTNTDPALTWLSNMGSRMAWMAMANLMVLVFLALKNTPLAILSSWSYERLNIFHQVAGTLTVVYVIIHACCYSYNFTSTGRPERLLQQDEIYGMIAGISFLFLGIGGVIIRRWWYELFYYSHVAFWMTGIIFTGMHQPEISKKVVYVVAVAGGLWVLDRLIRIARLASYSTNNSVIVSPLENGGTRVTAKKAPLGAMSGKHCFLWIPRIRPTETHPFTIVSQDPLEFVVSSHNGFTSSLHDFAKQNPGAELKASVEGPYGTFPSAAKYDKVILVAGGSGATFTFGTALRMLQGLVADDEAKEIVFIWTVRQKVMLKWFAEHLQTLQKDTRFKLKLYVTRDPPILQQVNSMEAPSPVHQADKSSNKDLEKGVLEDIEKPRLERLRADTSLSVNSAESADSEELSSPIDGITSRIHNVPINFERPKVASLIESAINDTPRDHSVLVMGCGPDELMKQVRDTTAGAIRTDGPSIELHCESFGW